MSKKIALGLSGGVDSSVAGWLLKEQGYEVTGVFLECFRSEHCRASEDRRDALRVAEQLDIPFVSLDFCDVYREKVLNYFYETYKAGLTPNPDILCNSEIKFGLFMEWVEKNNFDYLATGHYASIEEGKLMTAVDEKKDQSYFLARMGRENLGRVLFPLGDLKKSKVREIAKENNLITAEKKDSTGVCFVGEINVREFL
ncbi:tRNA 2-thiouridine(34) synthase MnmA, partial [Microgenomates group bacterium]|nr:tRNA 2-thiouridine(34) synthase MnmA [Microgenomates group bacterium]